MIGTTAAILTAAGIAAGSQVASSVIGSKAAKSAAQQQQASANTALQYANQAYNQQMQAQAPYYNQGTAAFNTLSRLLTPPSGAKYAAPALAMPNYLTPYSYTGGPAGTMATPRTVTSPLAPYMMNSTR